MGFRVVKENCPVCLIVDVAKRLEEGVVCGIELCPVSFDLLFRCIKRTLKAHLGAQHVAQADHALHAIHSLGVLRRPRCSRHFAQHIFAALHHITVRRDEVGSRLHAIGDGHINHIGRLGALNRCVDVGWQAIHPADQLVFKVASRLNGIFVGGILLSGCRWLAQHELRILGKKLIDAVRDRFACLRVDVLLINGSAPLRHIVWQTVRVALLEDQDVGHDFRAGVLLEGGIRKAGSANQRSAIPYPLAGALIHGIQEAMRHDDLHDAARSQLVDGFGKEIVVDTEARVRAAVHINDGLRTKRRVSDYSIKEL